MHIVNSIKEKHYVVGVQLISEMIMQVLRQLNHTIHSDVDVRDSGTQPITTQTILQEPMPERMNAYSKWQWGATSPLNQVDTLVLILSCILVLLFIFICTLMLCFCCRRLRNRVFPLIRNVKFIKSSL
jgi:hypothetical protein